MRMSHLLRGIVMLALKIPLYAAYGAWFLLGRAFRFAGEAGTAVRLLGESLRCPSCGEPNAIHGRWKCRTCGAVYHGAVFICPLCNAGAAFFPCAGCGGSVPIGRPR